MPASAAAESIISGRYDVVTFLARFLSYDSRLSPTLHTQTTRHGEHAPLPQLPFSNITNALSLSPARSVSVALSLSFSLPLSASLFYILSCLHYNGITCPRITSEHLVAASFLAKPGGGRVELPREYTIPLAHVLLFVSSLNPGRAGCSGQIQSRETLSLFPPRYFIRAEGCP